MEDFLALLVVHDDFFKNILRSVLNEGGVREHYEELRHSTIE